MVTVTSEMKIKREPGYLYYFGKDGCVWASPMKNNLKGKKHRVTKEAIKKQKGEFWFVMKDGTIGFTKR